VGAAPGAGGGGGVGGGGGGGGGGRAEPPGQLSVRVGGSRAPPARQETLESSEGRRAPRRFSPAPRLGLASHRRAGAPRAALPDHAALSHGPADALQGAVALPGAPSPGWVLRFGGGFIPDPGLQRRLCLLLPEQHCQGEPRGGAGAQAPSLEDGWRSPGPTCLRPRVCWSPVGARGKAGRRAAGQLPGDEGWG
jgi:hypothetical protein